jgi:hypothetical protein
MPMKILALSAMQFSSVLRIETFSLSPNSVKNVGLLMVVTLLHVTNIRVLLLLMTESGIKVFGQTE